jgi:hypothetical protein
VVFVPEVRLSIEEYEALVKAAQVSASVRASRAKTRQMSKAIEKKRRSKKDPKMAKALKEANRRGRTKSGKLRAGYTQAKIMKTAHKLRRKM